MINSINNAASAGSLNKNELSKNASSKKQAPKSDMYDSAYVVDISSEKSGEKVKGKSLGTAELESIKKQADMATASLRQIVEKLILSQKDNASKISIKINISITSSADEVPVSQTDAASSIGEDGEWGVNAVSDRIVAFAKAISGGDPSKIATLKDAIKEGMDLAEKAFGGELPEICYDTYDAVMTKLDDWANNTSSSAIE